MILKFHPWVHVYIPKRNKNTYAHQNLFVCVQYNILDNQKVKVT